MSYYHFAGYLLFALITSITPGPNNLILFSHGKSFGFKHSGRLMLGISLGFFSMLYAAGYGIAEIITRNQIAALTLKIMGSLWLVYLAFVLRKADSDVKADDPLPVGFWKVLFMQYVNPKAWIMAVSGASAFMFTFGNIHLNVFLFAFTFVAVGIPCMVIWIMLGDKISKILKTPRSKKILGNTLFVLLVASAVMVWF